MLKARTDLLWFGGIGTYIKATSETHGDAGDKGNDALRIDAPEIRSKVIGEGANLGATHSARICMSLLGIKCYESIREIDSKINCHLLGTILPFLNNLKKNNKNENVKNNIIVEFVNTTKKGICKIGKISNCSNGLKIIKYFIYHPTNI